MNEHHGPVELAKGSTECLPSGHTDYLDVEVVVALNYQLFAKPLNNHQGPDREGQLQTELAGSALDAAGSGRWPHGQSNQLVGHWRVV